ncbi:MAG: 6-pyruvoyl-tetrahydropterin synthase-related protein, partial [Patescibacteria group bacterium]
MKKIKEYSLVLVLIFLALLPVLPLFKEGLPVTHDGQDHVARIANFYLNLTEGNLIPRWAPNLNWGYGHPILEFLYPAPSYFASFFHFLGFSLVDSTKIIFGLGIFMSGIFMFLWLKQFLSKEAAFFGSFLYIYAPYRFVDLNVRGAIGENFVFIWIPLVLFFIFKLFETKESKYTALGGIAFSLMVLSHNAISLMFAPFILFYSVYLVYLSKYKKSLIINLLSLIILGLFLSAFFWFPALLEGKYTLRDIVTKDGYLTNFVSFKDLLYGEWNYGITGQFTVQLGIVHWLIFITSPFFAAYLFRRKNKLWVLMFGLFFYTLSAIFLMLPQSGFIWEKIMILQNFQFPWRFLSVTTFATAVLGGLVFSIIPRKLSKYLLIAFCLLILVLSKDYFYPKAYQQKPESFYSGIWNSTTDTGESAPMWSVRFMEKRPNAHLEVIDGNAYIKELKRTSTYHKYQLIVNKPT